jgi:hypothetical protein
VVDKAEILRMKLPTMCSIMRAIKEWKTVNGGSETEFLCCDRSPR